MDRRRELAFDSLDDVMADVDRLLDGHATLGQWSLGQILWHLATAIRLSIEGIDEEPPDPVPQRTARIVRLRMFRSDRFPEGAEVPLAALSPPPGLDARTEAEALREAIARFVAAPGPLAAHPLLGEMTKEEWEHFHRIHCGHHLGFAVAQGGGRRTGREDAG